jgi:general secretion pathway protein A
LYNDYFHFSESPFSIATDPHFIYMSPRHQEALAHLLYGINFGGGFVALTGEVGTGKTTLCHCLLQKIPDDIEIALILNPKLNAVELLATICDELGIRYDKKQQSLKNLIDLLNRHLLDGHAAGRRTVLLIDEAQNLSLEVLEQIRLLTNLETNKTKLLQIILVGQPELKESLKRQDLRQLNQRITARYHLLPLTLNETRAYIQHRLSVCNGRPDIFKERAIAKIYRLSSGIPRMINILCDRALLGAYSSNTQIITPAIVTAAADETLAFSAPKSAYLRPLLGLLFVACVGAAIYFHIHWPNNSNQKAIAPTIPYPTAWQKPEFVSQSLQTLRQQPLPVETFNPSPGDKPKTFADWIDNPAFTLSAALTSALKRWNTPIPEQSTVDCRFAEAAGLRCVFGQTSWKDILAFNRPAILEFSLPGKGKFYALLTGLRQNQTMIHFEDNTAFPVADVLKHWDGYYLTLQPPPAPYGRVLRPHQTSDDVLWLRYLFTALDGKAEAVEQPRFYDDKLAARIMDFQHQYRLKADGKIGDMTLPYLTNVAQTLDFPHLEIRD